MIVALQRDLLGRPLRLFFEGFQFLGRVHRAWPTTIVEYVFSLFFLSLLVMLFFSTGIILYTGLFQSREAAFLLTTPASRRPGLRLQVRRGDRLLELGVPAAGEPPDGRLRDHRRVRRWRSTRSSLAYLLAFVLIPGEPRARSAAILVAHFLPEAAEDGPDARPSAPVVARGLRSLGVEPGETPGRRPDAPTGSTASSASSSSARTRSGRAAGSPKGLIAAAGATGTTACSTSASSRPTPGLAYLVAAVVARDLYRLGLQPGPGGPVDAGGRHRLLRPRRALPPGLLLPARADPAADPQGPPHLPPRPGAVVAIPDLLRPAGVLLREHPAARLRHPERLLAEPAAS